MTAPKAECPHCGAVTIVDASNPYQPFCSGRCRLIDLGAWLDGNRRIPTDEPAEYHGSEDNDDLQQH